MKHFMTPGMSSPTAPSPQEIRKLELIAAIAGNHKLAVEELMLLLKLAKRETLGRIRQG
jgi:hypothetical protein